MSNKYGILAYPAKHSLSPTMMNAAFKNLGIDAEYGIFEISESGLENFLKDARKNLSGLSVSLPYKERVLKFMDFVDDDAKKIGAVNTVKIDNGRLFGYNTDFIGAVKALREGAGKLSGKRVVVVGAGGASRAIIYGLLMEKAAVTILNRHIERAKEIVDDFHYIFNTEIKYLPLDKKMEIEKSDILIQATSIWTLNSAVNEEELEGLFPDGFVNKFDAVMDVSYQPLKTSLLEKAERLGKKTITGDRMLLFQALEQFKIFTGKEAPIQIMESALRPV
jgi:shikimate dehydrogenase